MRSVVLLLSMSMLCILSSTIYFQTLYGQNHKTIINSAISANLTESTVENSIPPQSTSSSSDKLKVVSSFYPIYEFVKKVGGDKIDSLVLIPTGLEPHDFEPTINQIQAANSADALVFNGLGFETWIDKINTKNKIDASNSINASYIDNRTKSFDPHIWLDPVFAKKETENIRDGLIKIDPNNRDYYSQNAKIFINELDTLDKTIRADLKSCKKHDFVAFHNAFSYFAKRYGLNQHTITTTGPEEEIKPQRLVEIIQLAKNLGLHVIYSEELIDPRYALAVAQEIPDAKVLVLSPIEGLTKDEQSKGIGYVDKMNENIQNLKQGLECSQ
ncbi:MAG: ABC transporter substrate-binding protein [Thaumarchaeota archaeon]|nr:MAG: ABC transporter substrate-binding protein [Nitrososphaerota archaeon]TLX88171.1 MAG: ABC transporter substrate-binding protein [Nitrososphaerota archaeon]